MRLYEMTITFAGGSQVTYHAFHADGFAAAIDAIDVFQTARRISARRLA